MGPWTAATAPYDISCEPPPSAISLSAGGEPTPEPTPGQGCLYGGSIDQAVTRSQQSFTIIVPDGQGGSTYIYAGDRWGQAFDGLKGHEPQYYFPLSFNADGTINHITWNDTVSFNIEVAAAVSA